VCNETNCLPAKDVIELAAAELTVAAGKTEVDPKYREAVDKALANDFSPPSAPPPGPRPKEGPAPTPPNPIPAEGAKLLSLPDDGPALAELVHDED